MQQDDGDMFDDYDRHMMLHGLGLEDKATCDCLVTFQKDFKRVLGGRNYLTLVECYTTCIFGFCESVGRTRYILVPEK